MSNPLELAIVESHAVARRGMRGLGAMEGFGEFIVGAAIAIAGAPILVGVVAGLATKSWKVGLGSGVATSALGGLGTYAWSRGWIRAPGTAAIEVEPTTQAQTIPSGSTVSPITPPPIDSLTARAMSPLIPASRSPVLSIRQTP